MKKSFVPLAIVVGFVVASSLMAEKKESKPEQVQEEPVKFTPRLTAIIDMERIITNDALLEHRLAELVREAEKFANEVKEERQAIADNRRSLTLSFKPGTAEYQQHAEEDAKAEGELAALEEVKKEYFQRREARLYHEAFRRISSEVDEFAKMNNIALVVNANVNSVDEDDPDAVEARIRHRVVYQRNLDLTTLMLTKFEEDQTSAGGVTSGSLGNRPVEEIRALGLRVPFYKPALNSWGCRRPSFQ